MYLVTLSYSLVPDPAGSRWVTRHLLLSFPQALSHMLPLVKRLHLLQDQIKHCLSSSPGWDSHGQFHSIWYVPLLLFCTTVLYVFAWVSSRHGVLNYFCAMDPFGNWWSKWNTSQNVFKCIKETYIGRQRKLIILQYG